ncbi:MAG TPA: YkvA family protein [Longimicrobiaceae bacterium]|nr:YkvA family protein [Longimicrobiaceae bacterium]
MPDPTGPFAGTAGAQHALQPPRLRRRRSAEAADRALVAELVRDIPCFLKLLGLLVVDPRISRVDRVIVVATIGYVVMPIDLVPDFIPFFGMLDDLYLLALALNRLMRNAGPEVLRDHWDGRITSLASAIAGLEKAGSFLPARVRRLLEGRV